MSFFIYFGRLWSWGTIIITPGVELSRWQSVGIGFY
jgi:hypothetical protein